MRMLLLSSRWQARCIFRKVKYSIGDRLVRCLKRVEKWEADRLDAAAISERISFLCRLFFM